jgi:G3E family GTPase
MVQATEFVIVAGKLGSGKTSLIEAFLLSGNVGSATAVIVNEAGAINIDGAVLTESARGVPMARLSNGCVCCSLTDDLVITVEELVTDRADSGLPPFERIVLECSGLSLPGQVMGSLSPLSELGLRVRVMTTFDCAIPPLAGEDFETVSAQLAAAQTIVLTKIDQVSLSVWQQAEREAKAINPLATIVSEPSHTIRARLAFKDTDTSVQLPLPTEVEIPRIKRVLLHPRVRVLRARFAAAAEWDDVLDWLENVSGALGERLLRMKAIVLGPRGDDRVLLQSVGTTFSAPRRFIGDAASDLSAIFIVRDCSIEDIELVPSACKLNWTAL